MSATSGPFLEFKSPKTGYAYRQLMGTGSTNYVKDTSAIIVGADGTRFVSETVNLKHGHVMFHGLYIRVPISLPAFLVSHCYECPRDCKKGLLSKIKPYGFTVFIKRYGMEELMDCLERNEKNGIVYHREGIWGDYDDFDDVEALI